MATRSRIGYQQPDGGIITTYVHSGGSPSLMRPLLTNHWTSLGKIKKLISLAKSGISYLGTDIGKKHKLFDPPDESYTGFYGRDRGDKNNMIKMYDDMEDLIDSRDSDYFYIFIPKNKSWMGLANGKQIQMENIMKTRNQILLESKIRKMVREELLTENVDQVRKIVDSMEESILQRINRLQEKINLYKTWVKEKVAVYEKNYKTIENILRKHGFEFNSITSARQTGIDIDVEKFSLDTPPYFLIDAQLRMVGRRKTFADKGYASRGSEKQRGHHELADLMAKELKSACPDMSFDINPYSLVAKRGEKPSANQNVLFSMWVK